MGELAKRVRAKFPGVYDDIADDELEKRVRTKYPGVYDDLATTPNAQQDTTQAQPQGMGFGEAASAFLGNMQEPGAADLLLGPVKIAKEVTSRAQGPESVGAGVLPGAPGGGATALMNMILSFSQLAKEGQAQGVDTLQSAGMPGWLGALMKTGGIGQQIDPGGVVSGTAASGIEMARALKSLVTGSGNPTEDAKRFLSLLGSTTANVGSLGLEGTPTGLAQRIPGLRRMVGAPRGAQTAANSAPAAAPPSDAIPVPRSDVVPENVFGETPGASAALPEKPTIPQTVSQETGSTGAAIIERTLAASVTAADKFQDLMARQAGVINEWGRKIVSSISKDGATLPAREVGNRVKARLSEAHEMIKQATNHIWNNEVWGDPALLSGKLDLGGIPEPITITLSKQSRIASAARELIGKTDRAIKSMLEEYNVKQLDDIKDNGEAQLLKRRFHALRNFTEGGWKTDLQTLMQRKKDLFESGGSDQLLSRAIDDTIQAEIKRRGGDVLLNKYLKAKEMTKRLKTVEENALFKGMVDTGDTAGIADVFLNAGAEDRAMMRNLLKPKDVNMIVARKLTDILDNSTADLALWDPLTGEAAKVAAASGERVSGRPPVLSGGKVAQKIRNVGGSGEGLEVLGELLSPKQRSALGDFVNVAQEAGINNWKSINGVLVNSMLAGGALGLLAGKATNLGTKAAGLVSLGVSTRVLGHIMTHPEGIRAAANTMRAYGRAVKAGGKAAASPWSDPQVQFWGTRLAKLAAEQDEKNRDLEGVASDLPGGGYVAR